MVESELFVWPKLKIDDEVGLDTLAVFAVGLPAGTGWPKEKAAFSAACSGLAVLAGEASKTKAGF